MKQANPTTPASRLFDLTMEIRKAETVLRQARTIKRVGRTAVMAGPLLLVAATVAGLASRGIVDIGGWVTFAIILALVLCGR